ncbi:TMhelix containing protein [Vibrio phage 1.275.O._10N.286.54.E11]|nr:TMhelix containing protein [Vibrio phage 1.275.O._10N.286.54.E11]
MIDGSLDMKDGIGPTAVGTGFSLTLTPSLLLQIAGVVIGALGVFYTRARIKESKLARLEAKRANDINKERLLWEQGKHASQQNATTVQTEAGDESQADEANAEETSK